MEELQEEFDLTYLWISHNLYVVKNISNKVGFMYLGKLIELGDYEDIFLNHCIPILRHYFLQFTELRQRINRRKEIF